MKNSTHCTHLLSIQHERRAFALISTIMVMVLVMVIGLGMLSLSSTSSRHSSLEKAQVEAKANARLALNIAIAELQKLAGPDQRVTAEASILENPSDPSAVVVRHPHWMGVWRTDGLKSTPLDEKDPLIYRSAASSGQERGSLLDKRSDGSYVAENEVLEWMVSSPKNLEHDPLSSLQDEESVELVKGTTEVAVRAPKVRVENQITGGVGHYSWWVGDEGVKARFNLKSSENIAWRVPAQFGLDAIDSYEASVVIDDAGLEKTITRETSGIEEGANLSRKERKDTFHDVSFFSKGVLADTLEGGLRRDLTSFLRDGGADDLTVGGQTREGLSMEDPILSGDTLEKISAKFGMLKNWADLADLNTGHNASITPQSVDNHSQGTGWGWWGKQFNFYENASGLNLASQDKVPLHPVMIDAGISYGVSLEKIGASQDNIGRYRLNIHYYPRVVLWNPYNVKLKPADYIVQINMPHTFDVKVILPTSGTIDYRYFGPYHQQYGGENLPHRPHFKIPSAAFEAGEALLFTADAKGASRGNLYWGDPDTAIANDPDHFQLSCSKSAPFQDNFYIKTVRDIFIPDGEVRDAAYQIVAKWDARYKLYFYKLYLAKSGSGSVGLSRVKYEPSRMPLIQFISQTENGSGGSDAPWFTGIPASASSPLRERTKYTVTPYYRFKWGHRMQWIEDTVENANIKAGPYNAPYLGYNTIANHNLRAGWHVRSPVEVAFRATDSAGRYTHGISIDDPYGWDWADTSLYPVPVGGKNRVSPFGRPSLFGPQTYPLLDVPRKDEPILSIAELQHLPLSQFPWHPTNAIGNSLADPRVARHHTTNYVSPGQWDTIGIHERDWSRIRQSQVDAAMDQSAFLHDLSYEANYGLWDRYFFSTVPEDSSYKVGDELPNPRMSIVQGLAEVKEQDVKNYHTAARHMMIEGAFNINSTSEEAWAALLASMQDDPALEIPAYDGSTVKANHVFSRLIHPHMLKYDGEGETEDAMWTGYRELEQAQIRRLAGEIVKEVKQRGPFLSLSDFVNRRLVEAPSGSGGETVASMTGLKGTLQAAIDRTDINQTHRTNHVIEKKEYHMRNGDPNSQVSYEAANKYPQLSFPVANNNPAFGPKPDHNHWADTKLVGAPSYLTQADILQKLGPVLSARSDTFVIRTYGDSVDSSGKVLARVWCEAIVQRTPAPVVADVAGLDPKENYSTDPTVRLGRRMEVVSFRWLNENEL